MHTLQVVNLLSVRSVICQDFMTSHTTVDPHRLNTTIFSQLKPELITQNGLKWPFIKLFYHLLTSLSLSFIYIIRENSAR